jgi:glycosyltransferase involved in cell wall biosynthesis
MDGVDYRGSVGQADLARALSAAHILSYPNTFPETSCISVMEAMTAGLHVVSSHLGALPETGLGRASLVPFPPGPPDRDRLVADFTAAIIATLDERRARADRWLSARIADAGAILSAANWQKRTQEWLTLFAFLSNLR